MRIMMFVVLVVISSVSVWSVNIHEVYYYPQENSHGGEAFVLHNPGSEQVNLSGWYVDTATRTQDIVFPDLVLAAGQYLLVADNNWHERRDDLAWPLGDIEHSMTLRINDGGLALYDAQDNKKDAVGWGTNVPDGLYSQTPAQPVSSGQSLLRINTTGNNKNDFVASLPQLLTLSVEEEYMVPLEIVVYDTQDMIFNVSTSTNGMLTQEGVMPTPGKVLEVEFAVSIKFHDQVPEVYLEQTPMDVMVVSQGVAQASGSLEFSMSTPPGTYPINISTNTTSYQYNLTVLPVLAMSIDTQKLYVEVASFNTSKYFDKEVLIRNTGNIPLDLDWKTTPLRSPTGFLSAQRIGYMTGNKTGRMSLSMARADMILHPGDDRQVQWSIDMDEMVKPGRYTGHLVVHARSAS